MSVRLLLVDDHAIVRHGLRSVLELEPDLEVVGEAADRDSGLSAVGRLAPDIVLLDVRLTDEADGLDVCEEITRRHPEVAVVMLTTFLHAGLLVEALRRGASGYVLKDVDMVDLVRIIRAVHRGESGFDARTLAMVVQSVVGSAGGTQPVTAREGEVLRLVSRGRSNREIASELYISESTAKFHVHNLMRKLGVANRTEVVYVAAQRGLL